MQIFFLNGSYCFIHCFELTHNHDNRNVLIECSFAILVALPNTYNTNLHLTQLKLIKTGSSKDEYTNNNLYRYSKYM